MLGLSGVCIYFWDKDCVCYESNVNDGHGDDDDGGGVHGSDNVADGGGGDFFS